MGAGQQRDGRDDWPGWGWRERRGGGGGGEGGVVGRGGGGSAFAAGMVANGATVRGFDPAEVVVPAGVADCMTAAEAVEGADVVIALTHAAQALDAAESAVGHLGPGAF